MRSLGKLFGIDISLHYSWFFIFFLILWSLSTGFFPQENPNLSGIMYWVLGGISAVMLFASVLFHELSHSIVAKMNKIKVERITLFFFGGVAQISENKFSPNIEMKVALAGPMFSFVFAGLFFLIKTFNVNPFVNLVSNYLFQINLIIGGFNLVPGYPLDGGRVLRAVLWKRFNNIIKATYYAAKSGKIFAGIMMVFGFLGILAGQFGMLWFVFLGIFLYVIAGASYKQIVLTKLLTKAKVRDMVTKKFSVLNADMPIEKLTPEEIVKHEQIIFPVVKNKKVIGLFNIGVMPKLPESEKKKLKVGDLTTKISEKLKVGLNDNAYKAIKIMAQQKIAELPVISKGKMVGMIKEGTLINLVSLKSK